MRPEGLGQLRNPNSLYCTDQLKLTKTCPSFILSFCYTDKEEKWKTIKTNKYIYSYFLSQIQTEKGLSHLCSKTENKRKDIWSRLVRNCTVCVEEAGRGCGLGCHCGQHRPQYTCTVKAVHKVTTIHTIYKYTCWLPGWVSDSNQVCKLVLVFQLHISQVRQSAQCLLQEQSRVMLCCDLMWCDLCDTVKL